MRAFNKVDYSRVVKALGSFETAKSFNDRNIVKVLESFKNINVVNEVI